MEIALFLLIFLLILFILYVLEQFSIAKNDENLYSRSYRFRKKSYRIGNNNQITLHPDPTKGSSGKVALYDSLSELFASQTNLYLATQSRVLIGSLVPVWFHLAAPLHYPFREIDATGVILDSCLNGMLCCDIASNPIIERIVLPKTLYEFHFSISSCPSLKRLCFPSSDREVLLSMPDERFPIYDVHREFCIEVPQSLLFTYQSKYSNTNVRYSDGTISQLRFSSISNT